MNKNASLSLLPSFFDEFSPRCLELFGREENSDE
jgi:hypothetical protein